MSTSIWCGEQRCGMGSPAPGPWSAHRVFGKGGISSVHLGLILSVCMSASTLPPSLRSRGQAVTLALSVSTWSCRAVLSRDRARRTLWRWEPRHQLGLVLRTRADLGSLPGLLRPQCWQEWQMQALSWASGSPPGADREDEFLAVKTWGLLWPRLVLTTELSSDLGHCNVGKHHVSSGLALKSMRLKI